MTDFFWSNIFKQGDSEIELITRLWQNTPLFRNIPARHVASLVDNMHVRHYQSQEVVFHQGDQGGGAILVLDGHFRISANSTTLAELEQGDFFGEITLAETDKRTADATCTGSGRLVFFLKQDLEEWIEIEPRLGTRFLMNLASILAQRLHQASFLLSQKN
jgi:CRP-like cAMP-binding protein